jgi:hypothetical protein
MLLPTMTRSPLTYGVLRELLTTKARRREVVHVVLSPDELPGEAVELRQEAGHVVEVEMPAVDGRSGRDAALSSIARSGVGDGLVDPLDLELTHGRFVDRPALETARVEINSLRERRNLHRREQHGETLPALDGRKLNMSASPGHFDEAAADLRRLAVQRGEMLPPRSSGRKQKRAPDSDIVRQGRSRRAKPACEDPGSCACYGSFLR